MLVKWMTTQNMFKDIKDKVKNLTLNSEQILAKREAQIDVNYFSQMCFSYCSKYTN